MRSLSVLSLILVCTLCSNGYAQPGRTSKTPRPMFPGGLRIGMTVDEVKRVMTLPPMSATTVSNDVSEGERVVSYRVGRVYGVTWRDWDCMFNSSGKLVMVSAVVASEGAEENTRSFNILGDSLRALLGEPTSSTEIVNQAMKTADSALAAADRMLDSLEAVTEGKALHTLNDDEVETKTTTLETSEEMGPFVSWEFPLSKRENILSLLYIDPETKTLSLSLQKMKVERRGR